MVDSRTAPEGAKPTRRRSLRKPGRRPTSPGAAARGRAGGATPGALGYRVLDRFSPVEMGPKWTGRSGELRRRKVAPCADCRLGRAGSAVWEQSVCPVGVPCKRVRRGRPLPRAARGPAGLLRWRRRKRGAAGTDVANCGERLVGVSVGSATKPTCSGRGRLRPARREMSECGPGPAGDGLAPSGGWRQRKSFGHDGFGGAQHRRDQCGAGRGGVGGRYARRWPAPAGCRPRAGCGCRRRPYA